MKNKSSTFCVKAFGGLSVSPSGGCSPCCLYEGVIKKNEVENFSIFENSIEEIYSSDFMIDLRKKMLSGEKIPGCVQCYQIEESGGRSLRLQSNLEMFEKPNSLSVEKDLLYPASLDLKMNNKCNLKCRMCQPRDSNLIHEEFKKIIKENKHFAQFENSSLLDPDLKIDLDEVYDWANSVEFNENFLKILPTLKKISIVGGEPLILNELYNLFELCIEKDAAKNIYLAITTNLMTVPFGKLEEYFPHFKRILLNISLDAVENEINYIRFPSQFEKIVSNFKKVYELKKYSNLIIQFSPTVQVYNVLTLHKVYEFVEKILNQGFDLSNTPINLTFLEFPKHLNIRVLPENVKKRAYENLNTVLKNCPKLMKYDVTKSNLEVLMNILIDQNEYDKSIVQEFIYYTEILDKKRGQSFKEYLPDLANLLIDYQSKAPEVPYYKLRENGWKLADQKQYKEAIDTFRESLNSSPDKYLDYREMAWMALEMKDYNLSLEFYRRAFNLNSNDPFILKGYCVICNVLHLADEIKIIIDQAILLNPNDEFLMSLKQSN